MDSWAGRVLIILCAVPLWTAAAQSSQPQTSESPAGNYYRQGMAFLERGQYGEALEDFQRVVDGFPDSDYCDDALLQIAIIRLDVEKNLDQAQALIERLKTQYPSHNTTPHAYVLSGRLTLTRDTSLGGLERALADFDRVSGLFPDATAATAEADYRAGSALRQAQNCAAAELRLRRILAGPAVAPWTAQAKLDLGRCLAESGRLQEALREWQGVIRQFPGTPEALRAEEFNGVVARLSVVGPSSYTAFHQIGVPRGDVWDLHVAVDRRLYVGQSDQVSHTAVPAPLAAGFRGIRDGRGIASTSQGQIVVAEKRGVRRDGMTRALTYQGRPLEDITDVEVTSGGDLLVADKNAKVLARFTAEGAARGRVAALDGEARLARNEFGEIAVLDLDSKSVTVVDDAGGVRLRLPQRGTGYQLDRPADVAWGPLNHLYVLDRSGGGVVIFAHGGTRPVGVFQPGAGSQAGPLRDARLLAVDPLGRLFVYDRARKQIIAFH